MFLPDLLRGLGLQLGGAAVLDAYTRIAMVDSIDFIVSGVQYDKASSAEVQMELGVVCRKIAETAHNHSGGSVIGFGDFPDRIIHLSRAHGKMTPKDWGIMRPRTDSVRFKALDLDVSTRGNICVQNVVNQGTVVYRIDVIDDLSQPGHGQPHSHLYYGILPHPTSTGQLATNATVRTHTRTLYNLAYKDILQVIELRLSDIQ